MIIVQLSKINFIKKMIEESSFHFVHLLKNCHLYHYANNNPVRYVDPTGRFDWDTNTIESNDCLSQIAFDCNKIYGTNYTAEDLKSLNPYIIDKDIIYEGYHLNLGKADTIKSLSLDYINRATTSYSSNQLAPIIQFSIQKKQGYSRRANIFIGTGEILLGVVFYVGSTIAAGKIEIDTCGVGTYYAGMAIVEGYAAGSLFIGYGIARLTDAYNDIFVNDIKNTLIPAEVDIATNMKNKLKQGNN